MLVSGSLLGTRGAVFPALQSIGLSEAAVRRAWAAFRYGAWEITTLLASWEKHVQEAGPWQPRTYGGYRLRGADITGFFRPALQDCPTQHYHEPAGRALPAILQGLSAQIGEIAGQRFPLLDTLVRVDPDTPTEASLQRRLLAAMAETQAPDEAVVLDAGFTIEQCQSTDLKRWVLRLPTNAAPRRNTPKSYAGQGRRPEYGARVRPLARTYDGNQIEATPPDEIVTFQDDEGNEINAFLWDELVRADLKADPNNPTFTVALIHDPNYQDPLLVAYTLDVEVRVIWQIYRDRWPVEQIPLSAKQMLGAHRQFVWADESCQRLPELSLLAGNIITYLAATLPAIPTGFWDRQPERTPGRLRRALEGVSFPENAPRPQRIRKKASATEHLPKGHVAQQQAASTS